MHAKKTRKIEKRASVPPLTDRVGGLAEAAGKVRKGNPSGTGRLKAIVQNHASTPVGYGEFRTLRATAAPSTYGPGTWGETPIADHPLIQTLGKTWARTRTQNEAENH